MALFRMRHIPPPTCVVFRVAAILPSFQILRGIREHTMGVAPFARASAMNLFKYQPKLWTTSCCLVSWLSISCVSSPVPLREARARKLSLTAPSSLWPNCIITSRLASASEDSVPVALAQIGAAAEPAHARLTTLILAASK